MFMLGSFTSGLFSGASDVFTLAHNYMKFKDDMAMRNAADEVQNNMLSGGSSGTSSTAGSSTGGDTSRPSYDTFDDDPELSKLPKLMKKTAAALKGFGESGREGKAYGSTAPATPTSTPTDEPPKQAAIGALTASPENVVSGAYNAGKAAGGGALDWLGSLGAKLHNMGLNHDHETPPPTYLPPEKPPNVGPAGAGGGAGPGTLDTLQQHGALMGGVGYPGGPSLAMQQNPIGARIMAAINPTAGQAT